MTFTRVITRGWTLRRIQTGDGCFLTGWQPITGTRSSPVCSAPAHQSFHPCTMSRPNPVVPLNDDSFYISPSSFYAASSHTPSQPISSSPSTSPSRISTPTPAVIQSPPRKRRRNKSISLNALDDFEAWDLPDADIIGVLQRSPQFNQLLIDYGPASRCTSQLAITSV